MSEWVSYLIEALSVELLYDAQVVLQRVHYVCLIFRLEWFQAHHEHTTHRYQVDIIILS